MRLFFLRHGIAESGGGKLDAERELTEEGRSKLLVIGRALQRLGVNPDVVLTSPLARALQTAEIVAPMLGSSVEQAEDLSPGCMLDDLQRLLERYSHETIMVVGHEPDFSSMAARLINADERGILLKKAGLIRIETDGRPREGRGRLTALLTPKMMMLMAGDESTE